ncbi:hypothetical protein [Halorubrum sp. CSM-61]|uniref:hypothetical protein n=1 Tax=Halorubrum sp. CSM-61 TaxID=2485838 RepID=UPI000F4CAC08|nr:hypothetical protein [Halorubrum sp. CSM-61]
MIDYSAVVGIVAIAVTVLMVVAMLYLVWDALDGDAHTPSPDRTGHSDFGDGDEAGDGEETQGELTDGVDSA